MCAPNKTETGNKAFSYMFRTQAIYSPDFVQFWLCNSRDPSREGPWRTVKLNWVTARRVTPWSQGKNCLT